MSDVRADLRRDQNLVDASMHPIVPGFFPDPTICRVGEDYYLTHSSFEYFPGAPIFHSTDLVSWVQIGNILDRRSQFRAATSGPSTGIYAPTLRHHDGKFWFITTNVSDFGAGQLIVSATDPAGPWSEPVFVPEATGIDPDLCWDRNGQAYLTWHVLDFRVGGKGIYQAPIDLTSGKVLEPPYRVWQGSGSSIAEGPHLYYIGDYWYIVLAEGGTERGHSVTIARSDSLRGPFEPCPWNPIITRRSTTHPVQSVGHADLIRAPDGRWAAVYLGTRPRGSTPAFHVLGRETFLAGVDWVEGWPVFDETRYRIPRSDTTIDDQFASGRLHPRWVVADGEPDQTVRVDPSGGLQFLTWGTPADFLCTRVRDLDWVASVVIEEAGALRLRLDDRHWCGLLFDGGTVRATVRIGDFEQTLAEIEVSSGEITLRISTARPQTELVPFGHAGPDEIVLSVRTEDGFEDLAQFDGRYFSTEVASGFTGRMLALGSPTPEGRVLSFRYAPRNS